MSGHRTTWSRFGRLTVSVTAFVLAATTLPAIAAEPGQDAAADEVSIDTSPTAEELIEGVPIDVPPVTDADRIPVPVEVDSNGISDPSFVKLDPGTGTTVDAVVGDEISKPSDGGATYDAYAPEPYVGTHYLVLYPEVVNEQKVDGTWVRVPVTISAAEKGFVIDAETYDVAFPLALAADAPVVLTTATGSTSSTIVGAKSADGSIGPDGTLRYAEALPATDVIYAAAPGGYEEMVALTDPSASPVISWDITTIGYTLAKTDDGRIELTGTDGTTLEMAAPVVFDSSASPVSGAATYELIPTGDATYEISVLIDPVFLASATYPVFIDPGTTQPSVTADTYVEANQPNQSNGTSPDLITGPGASYRTFMRFGTAWEDPDQVIYSAMLNIRNRTENQVGQDVEIDRATWDWNQSMTWNTMMAQSGEGVSATPTIGDQGGPTNDWWTIQLKNLYQDYAENEYPDYGFRLRSADSKTFDSSEGTLSPYLVISYNTIPNTAQLQTPDPGATFASKGGVTLKVMNIPADPDGDEVLVRYQVTNTLGSWGCGGSGQNCSDWVDEETFNVPTGWLTDGGTFYWRVQSADICTQPSGLCDTTKPDGTNIAWHTSEERSFLIALKNRGTDSRYATWSESLGNGMHMAVNEANGNLYLKVPVDKVPTALGRLAIGFTYNSQAAASGTDPQQLGPGWRMYAGPDSSGTRIPVSLTELSPAPYAGIEVTYASGRTETFPWRAGDVWGAIAGEGTVTKTPGNTFSYVTDDGDSYAFDTQGFLTEARGSATRPKAAGNPAAFYAYDYATDGRLLHITDPLNRTIDFIWTAGGNPQLQTIVNNWTNSTWTITYGSDRLQSVKNPIPSPNAETVQFYYAAAGGTTTQLLNQVRDGYQQNAGKNGWQVSYLNDTAPAGINFDVLRVDDSPPGGNLTLNSGKNWDLDYGSNGYFGYTSKTTTIQDPRGLASVNYTRVVEFNDSGLPIRITAPETATPTDDYITTMVWNSNNQLLCSRSAAANALDGFDCIGTDTSDDRSTEHDYDPEAPFRLLETRSPTSAGGAARMIETTGYDAGATFDGLWATWFENPDLAGVPDEVSRMTNFNQTWTGTPPGLNGADNWSLRLTGELTTQVDRYEFQLTGNDGYNLVIDNTVLLSCFYDDAPPTGATTNCGDTTTPKKKFSDTDHTITIELREETDDARLKLEWRKVGAPSWNVLVDTDVIINLGLRTDRHVEPSGGNTDLERTTTWAYVEETNKVIRRPSTKTTTAEWDFVTQTRQVLWDYDDWGRWNERTKFNTSGAPQRTSRTFTDSQTRTCLDVVTMHDTTFGSAAGIVTDTDCNTHGDVTSVTKTIRAVAGQPLQNRVTTMTYDQIGRPLTVTTPAAEGGQAPQVRTTYDRSGRPTKLETLLRGTGSNSTDWAVTDLAYNDHPTGSNTPTMTETAPLPNCSGCPARAVTVHTYDWVGNETKRNDPNNKDWLTEYDAQNRVTKVTTPDPDAGGLLTTLVTSTLYKLTTAEHSVTVTDPSLALSKTWLDELSRTVRTQSGETLTSPPGVRDVAPTWTSYDSAGNAIRVQQSTLAIGVGGNTIFSWRENDYDAFGKPREMREPKLVGGVAGTATTIYDYDPDAGDLTSVNGPMPDDANHKDVVEYTWDRWRRLTSTRMWTKSGEDFVTDVVYDDASEQVQITSDLSADGSKQQVRDFVYNPAGLIDAVTEYHGTNSATTSANVTTSYLYDQANRLIAVDSPRYAQTNELKFLYDDLGRETLRYRETSSSSGTTCSATRADCIATTYEIDGQVATTSRTNLGTAGLTYTWAHDFIGRDTTLTPSSGAATTWSYYGTSGETTLKGLLKSVAAPGNTSTFNYYTSTAGGPRGALRTAADTVAGLTATYTYDAAGRVTKRTDTTLTIDRTYEAETGRIDTQHVWKSSSNPVRSFGWFNLGYDESGNVTSRTERLWAAGSTVTTPPLETRTSDTGTGPWTYSYDGAGRMLTAAGPNSAGAAKTWTYTYDGQGNRLSETDGTTTKTWTTDDQGWFKTLDVSGGTSADATYSFAPDGALDLVEVGSAGISVAGDLDLDYDSWGQTITAAVPGTTVTNTIDALGRTVSRSENGGTATTLAYEGASESLSTLTQGTEIASYSSTPGGPYARKVGSTGTVQLSIRDLHGDQVGEIAKAANALSRTTWFSPFGESTALTSNTLPVSGLALGYQGQLTDPDSTTVDMTTRQYLPSLGRFTTRDVLQGDPANPPSLNQFVYGLGNPVTMHDSTGLGSTPDTIEEAPSTTAPEGTKEALHSERCDYVCEFEALTSRPEMMLLFGVSPETYSDYVGVLGLRILAEVTDPYCSDGSGARLCGILPEGVRKRVSAIQTATVHSQEWYQTCGAFVHRCVDIQFAIGPIGPRGGFHTGAGPHFGWGIGSGFSVTIQAPPEAPIVGSVDVALYGGAVSAQVEMDPCTGQRTHRGVQFAFGFGKGFSAGVEYYPLVGGCGG